MSSYFRTTAHGTVTAQMKTYHGYTIFKQGRCIFWSFLFRFFQNFLGGLFQIPGHLSCFLNRRSGRHGEGTLQHMTLNYGKEGKLDPPT